MTTTLASSSSDLLVPARARGGSPAAHDHAHGHDHTHGGHDPHGHDHGAIRGVVETGDGLAATFSQGGGHRHVAAAVPGGWSLIRASLAARLAVAAGLSILIWAAVLWARSSIAS